MVPEPTLMLRLGVIALGRFIEVARRQSCHVDPEFPRRSFSWRRWTQGTEQNIPVSRPVKMIRGNLIAFGPLYSMKVRPSPGENDGSWWRPETIGPFRPQPTMCSEVTD